MDSVRAQLAQATLIVQRPPAGERTLAGVLNADPAEFQILLRIDVLIRFYYIVRPFRSLPALSQPVIGAGKI